MAKTAFKTVDRRREQMVERERKENRKTGQEAAQTWTYVAYELRIPQKLFACTKRKTKQKQQKAHTHRHIHNTHAYVAEKEKSIFLRHKNFLKPPKINTALGNGGC